MLHFLTHPKKDNNQTENNQTSQKNQTVLKSDNQRVKEETYIQIGMRGGDRNAGWRRCAARLRTGWTRWQLEEGIFHIHMQIDQEKQLGIKTDHATQGFSAGK